MTRIDIKGVIIQDSQKQAYENAKLAYTSVSDVTSELKPGEDVEIYINSIGGDVFAGNEIFTALKAHDGQVNVNIIFAASIATVISSAGDNVLISPTGQYMIHNVSSVAQGDYREMEQRAKTLKSMNEVILSTYVNKTGLTEEEVSNMMDNETWFNAKTAVEYGFVDGVMFEEVKNQSFVACLNNEMTTFENVEEKENKEKNIKTKVEIKITDLDEFKNVISEMKEEIKLLKEKKESFDNKIEESIVKKPKRFL